MTDYEGGHNYRRKTETLQGLGLDTDLESFAREQLSREEADVERARTFMVFALGELGLPIHTLHQRCDSAIGSVLAEPV